MAIESKDLLVQLKAFARAGSLPLDATEVQDSKAAAEAYIQTPNAYAGQTIKVLENGKYNSYVINGTKGSFTLEKVGLEASQIKQEVRVVDALPESGQEQGVVYINTTDKKGYIWTGTWVQIFEQVDGLGTTVQELTTKVAGLETTVAGKADKADTLAGYGITDAMTATEIKSEIASAIAGAEHLKRIIVDILPEVGTADVNAIYMLKKDQGTNQKFEEFMVINGAWEKIGDSAVDLSGYATETFVNDAAEKAKNDAITAAATDATNKADAAKTAAVSEAKTYTDAEIIKAKEAAATDAQNKADAAQAEAIKQANAYTDTKDAAVQQTITTIQENLNTKVTADDVKLQLNTRLGDKISENTTVADYVDAAVGAGGSSSAEAIAKAKEEAINTSKAYTDSSLTLIEF